MPNTTYKADDSRVVGEGKCKNVVFCIVVRHVDAKILRTWIQKYTGGWQDYEQKASFNKQLKSKNHIIQMPKIQTINIKKARSKNQKKPKKTWRHRETWERALVNKHDSNVHFKIKTVGQIGSIIWYDGICWFQNIRKCSLGIYLYQDFMSAWRSPMLAMM